MTVGDDSRVLPIPDQIHNNNNYVCEVNILNESLRSGSSFQASLLILFVTQVTKYNNRKFLLQPLSPLEISRKILIRFASPKV